MPDCFASTTVGELPPRGTTRHRKRALDSVVSPHGQAVREMEETIPMKRTTSVRLGALAGALGLGLTGAAASVAGQASAAGPNPVSFRMVRSANAQAIGCLPKAHATVTVTPTGPVETMRVVADGLPPSTGFDLFVIQVPDAPFGMSWYQGDLETNQVGHADQTYVGRFNVETFSVAPNVAAAPVVHTTPIKDADKNPATPPVHQYHLGIWFNSPKDATAAGCQSAVTPFNGEHNAGVQALSTRNFPPLAGPLSKIKP
jgi:hypothetical protein